MAGESTIPERQLERAVIYVGVVGIRLLFWLFLAVLAVEGAKGGTTAFNLAVDRANQAINSGQASAAEKQIDAVLKADPKAAEGLNLRGVLRLRQGRYDDAAGQFNEALARNPKFYPAKFNLADVALLKGDAWDALRRFQDLQTIDPGSEVLQFKIALCYVLVGEDARATATASLIRFPGNTPAYYYARAAGWMKKENWPQVAYYLESAHKYYEPGECAYFESSLRAVGLRSSRRSPTAANTKPSSHEAHPPGSEEEGAGVSGYKDSGVKKVGGAPKGR